MLTRASVLEVLHTITDPCSISAGVPISVVDMGLVPVVELATNKSDPFLTDVSLAFTVTEPTCLMYHAFAREADTKLRELINVGSVCITVLPYTMWTEDDMTVEARERLAAARRRRRPVPVEIAAAPPSSSPARERLDG
jgi:metal-sulfur cluster biosynthetic enzyme